MLTNAYVDDLQIHPLRSFALAGSIGIVSIQGLGAPSPRGEAYERARRHGMVNRTSYYSGRVLDVQGMIVAETDAAAITVLDSLKQTLRLGADRRFKMRRAGLSVDEYADVRVASALEWDALQSRHQHILWAVQLLAADPRFYSDTASSTSGSTVAGGGGLSFPLVFPLTFSSQQSSVTATNNGNFVTPPTLTVAGPVTDPVVRNVTTSKSISLSITLGSSDSVVIDVAARTVTLNGVTRNDLVLPASTEWWELEPGANSVRLLGSGMVNGTTTLTVAFRDARI